MAFNYVGQRNNSGSRNLTKPIVITGSQTVAVGDFVETHTVGTADNPTAAQPGKGFVHAITNANGLPLVKSTHTAGTAHTPDTTSVTGDGTQYVIIDTAETSLYSTEVNGTVGTTTNSDLVGGRIDVDSANTDYGRVLETTNTRTIGTPANFYNHGTDPEDSTRLIVSLAMSEERSTLE